jgi:hypothetical protein
MARVRRRAAGVSERRKPTYGTATRLGRIVLGVVERPHGWSFGAIQDEPGIGEQRHPVPGSVTLLRLVGLPVRRGHGDPGRCRDLWEQFHHTLPEPQRVRLADFPKKFYAMPYAMTDYREFDDTLDPCSRSAASIHSACALASRDRS